MGLPEITVEFKHLAETAARRSARGFLAVILRDATAGVTWTVKPYRWLSEVKESDFSAANYKILARAFDAQPARVTVVRVGASGTMAQAAELLRDVTFDWICAPYAALQADLVSYVKEINTARRVRPAKALVYQQAADDIHIVSAWNPTVTLAGETSTTPMVEYLPRLAGLLAACPMTGSVTNAALEDLAAAADYMEPETETGLDGETSVVSATYVDPGDGVDRGMLMLYRDDGVIRIARGVNTLQTVSGNLTEDMKKIAVVEAMDLIRMDIIRTFKVFYLAKVRNSADNQALFVSDVLLYLRQLEAEGILEEESSAVAVDTDAMRRAWDAEGQSVADLTDAQVRAKTYRSYVFVAAETRILDAMEDLRMTVSLG